ncbi:MAG TPA: ABC transporter substrate-binding protein [Stellaceae bacterium]|nr:ABC transporter substrate-binding protein [Stellaceae bacterium]
MSARKFVAAAIAIAAFSASGALAQTVKVGIINTYSGPFAEPGDLIDRGITLYMKQHEKDLPPGIKIELIKRDDTGPQPDVAKRLAQELITRDQVQILAGIVYTPNAMAIAPLVTEAKVPLIVMNASTPVITMKSPYIARVSFTLWHSSYPLGQWAAKHDIKTAYTAVSDYAPGADAEEAFVKGFTESGGQILGSVRIPLQNPDFAPYLQKAKDAKPAALFVFVPAGTQAIAVMKAFSDVGLKQAGIKLIGPGDITTDEGLDSMGDAALDVITMGHYSAVGKAPANAAFVQAYQAEFGKDQVPAFEVVGGYDGMAAIFNVVIAQKGKIDPEKTMALLKGWKYDSARGPTMIDPDTRDIVQNEYVRRVERVNGHLANVEFETIPMVKDPWKVINNKQ